MHWHTFWVADDEEGGKYGHICCWKGDSVPNFLLRSGRRTLLIPLFCLRGGVNLLHYPHDVKGSGFHPQKASTLYGRATRV